MRLLCCFLYILFVVTGCAYNTVEEVEMGPPISYDLEVKPIIINNCYRCHSDTATADPDASGVPAGAHWDHFDQLQQYALQASEVPPHTRISAKINHVGFMPYMPYNRPKLSDSDIEKIDRWIRQGALNN